MNNDFRISVSFKNSVKRKKLHRLLGPDAVICLIDLWAYATENRPLGALTDMTADDIEIVVDWCGKNGVFVETLVDLKWLDFDGEIYHLHNWEKRNPWAFGASKRSEQAKKAINARWEKQKNNSEQNQQVNTHSNTPGIRSERLSNTPLLSSPLLTLPKPKTSSSNSSGNTVEGSAENQPAKRRISEEVEKVHFAVFGHPITAVEVAQLEAFGEPEILGKYQEALTRQGTGKDVRFFSWIVIGLKGGSSESTKSGGGLFGKLRSKGGKIREAYS